MVVFEILILWNWTFFFLSVSIYFSFYFWIILDMTNIQREIFIAYIRCGHTEILKSFQFEVNGTIQQNKTLRLMVCIHYRCEDGRPILLMHIYAIAVVGFKNIALWYDTVRYYWNVNMRERQHVCTCVYRLFFLNTVPGKYSNENSLYSFQFHACYVGCRK